MTPDDQRVKHLEMLQVVITRLGQNSFAVRGWSVTLVSVLFALIAAKDSPPAATLVALVPSIVFWGLDAYYLRQERLFRRLYAAVAQDVGNAEPSVAPFSMDVTPFAAGTPTWQATLASRTVLPIPVVLTVIAIGYTVVTVIR